MDLTARLDRLASRLFDPGKPWSDLPIDGYKPPTASWQPRQAAVLIPIVLEPEPALLLTVRSHALKSHAGQVAFPGGGRDGQENFPLQTALREAHEEVGIEPDQVRVLGMLQCFDTISVYRIVPVVGVVQGALSFVPCPREVRRVFRLPLEQALDLSAYRQHAIRHRQRRYAVWSMRSARWPVWGATAAMLQHLAQIASHERWDAEATLA
ncbi:MAG: CoA pyrophosphatase [Wenzhouxiangella sp.]